MWLASFAQVLVLMIPAADPGVAWVASSAALPKSIATRQTMFSIPFQVNQNVETGREAVEVQLFVSGNRGARWDMYGRVEPAKGNFLFRASGDGEYWFLIRTLDRSGQLRPQYNNNPGLVVVVDTTAPVVQLDAARGDAGQITAKWQITEANLNLDSFQIQYRTTSSQAWQTVAIDRQSVNTSGPTQSGEVTWWPRVGSGRVEIRAEVSDTAGNATVTHQQVNLDSGPVAYPGPYGNTVAQAPAGPSMSAPAADPAWRGSPGIASSQKLLQNHHVGRPRPSDSEAPNGSEIGSNSSVAAQANPPVRNQFVAASQPKEPSNPVLPHPNFAANAKRPRMVNARLFELDYNIDSRGASGISRIELWGTADGGKSWSSFGTDDDNRSPMLVTVNQEGIYGFRITAQNGPGTAPRPGDPPEIWIGVDLTKPTAQIKSVEQPSGEQPGPVVIQWRADDRALKDKPVTLLYSDTPGGPWLSIAAQLENSGQYTWMPDSRVPARIYVRLEVRDEAGNVATVDAPKAVELSQPQPRVNIRDIRPLNDSARTPPKRYHFHK